MYLHCIDTIVEDGNNHLCLLESDYWVREMELNEEILEDGNGRGVGNAHSQGGRHTDSRQLPLRDASRYIDGI